MKKFFTNKIFLASVLAAFLVFGGVWFSAQVRAQDDNIGCTYCDDDDYSMIVVCDPLGCYTTSECYPDRCEECRDDSN